MKKLIRYIVFSATMLVSLYTINSCQTDELDGIYEIGGMYIYGVTDGKPKQVREGDSAELEVDYTSFSYQGSGNMKDPTFEWSSSDESIVSIDSQTGKYYAISPGTCTITVTNVQSNTSVMCTMEVLPLNVEKVELNHESYTMKAGETLQLRATLTPDNALYNEVKWVTSDSDVAIVTNMGSVVAKNEGTCTIMAQVRRGEFSEALKPVEPDAKLSFVYAECQITVLANSATSIIISHDEATLYIGDRMTLTATVLPDYLPNSEKVVKWVSSDPNIAFVSSIGEVVAKKEGSCEIFAVANNGMSAVCNLQVKAIEVIGVTLNQTECTLDVGEESNLLCCR